GSQIFTYQFTFNWDAIGNLSRFKKTARFPKPKYYGTEINSRMTEAEIQERFLNSGKSSDFNHNLAVFYGIGDGGRGPLELEIMYADALVKLHNGRHVSQHQFFREQKEYVGERYLIWNDEQYLEFHRGVKTTQAMMKHLHRRAEYIANASENLVTMNNLINPDFTNIDKNIIFEFWRKVLFNEFHDILPGSSIPDVYRLARKEMKLSIESSMELIAENLVLLKEKANLSLGHKEDSEFQQEHEQKNDAKTSSAITGSKSKNYNYRYAIVYNPSCWERSGYALANPNHISYAHDEGMNKIFMAKGDTSLEGNNNNSNENGGKYIYHFKDLPPLSVTLQEIEYLCSSPDNNPIIKNEKESPFNEIYKESEEFFVLENDYIKATIDKKKGSLVSLKLKNASKDNNKGTDYEFLYTENTYKNMGAGLRIFSENPKQYPAWNLDKYYPTKKVPYYIVGEAYLKTNEAGIKVVHVDFAFGNNKKSKLFIEFFLLPEDKFLRIRIHTDIKDKKVLVKYFVPLTIKSEWVTAEIPYASIERRRFKKSEREKAKWEMPMQKWIDISDSDSGENSVGLAIINDNRYGFNATRKGVYISIVRTPKYPGVSPLYGATRTIPPSERPKYTDMEPLDFNLLLYPHKGDWKEAKVWQEAHDFNLPIFFMPLEINQTETQEEKFNATINGLNEFNNKFGFEFLRIEDRDVNNIFVNVIKAPEWTGPNLDKLTENDDWTWDKKSFIVRMTEIYGKETEFTIKFSDKLKIKEVIGVNLLEMAENSEIDNNTTLIDGNRIKTRIGKYEIKTLLIKLK
ncbi:MAG: glycoside hydrolase family 38 C-terminal domain-containing protein, partial [Promethearchaeota archaeon]